MGTNGTVSALRDRGVGELVKDFSGQVSTLARQEIELAKTEMVDKGKKAGRGAGMLAGAGVAGLLALVALTAFMILAFATALPGWASALIVTAIWAAVAGVLAPRGLAELRDMGKPVPEKTVETVKEDVQWLTNRK